MTVSTSSQELPSPWREFLDKLDQALSEPVELHCIGGFVISSLYGLPRPTGDVDYVSAIPRNRIEELERLAGRDSKLARKNQRAHAAPSDQQESIDNAQAECLNPQRFSRPS